MDYFLLIKPDGQNILPEIMEMCRKRGFLVSSVHYTNKWKTLCNELYKVEGYERGSQFIENLEVYIWINQKLFGNDSLILILKTESPEITQDGLTRIFELKMAIRENNIPINMVPYAILVNVPQIEIEHHVSKSIHEPPVLVETGEPVIPFFSSKGYWRAFYLNYVHCPDPTIDAFSREYLILENYGVFNDTVPDDIFCLCVRYRTFAFAKLWHDEAAGNK